MNTENIGTSSSGLQNSPRSFGDITKSPHLFWSCTYLDIFLQFCASRSSKFFSTTFIHLFRGRPRDLLPSGFQFSTILINTLVLHRIGLKHFILWHFMNPFILTTFNSSFITWLNFFLRKLVLVTMIIK